MKRIGQEIWFSYSLVEYYVSVSVVVLADAATGSSTIRVRVRARVNLNKPSLQDSQSPMPAEHRPVQ